MDNLSTGSGQLSVSRPISRQPSKERMEKSPSSDGFKPRLSSEETKPASVEEQPLSAVDRWNIIRMKTPDLGTYLSILHRQIMRR